jgi:ATP-dependent Clp protease ATP-binding subunit ClpA
MEIIKKLLKGGLSDAIAVDAERMTGEAKRLERYLLRNIIGQDRAVHQLVKAYESFQAGINDPNKPLANLLFLGPTGSGKTRLVEVFCEHMWGDPAAFIKVDCAEYSHSHEVSKLIGSPPGYVGYASGESRISKEKLEAHWSKGPQISVLLFDEIEKAHEDFHQILLGVLDRGVLTLGKGDKVDLTKCFIIMTSNLGAKAVSRHLNNQEIGYSHPNASGTSKMDQEIYTTSMEAVKKFFQPEFVNRVDRVVVFRSLSEESIRSILDIELDRVQKRLKDREKYIVIGCSKTAKDFLIKEGVNLEFGARELRRAIERFLVNKLARIIATKQAVNGDLVKVDHEAGAEELSFSVLKGVVDMPPPPPPEPEKTIEPSYKSKWDKTVDYYSSSKKGVHDLGSIDSYIWFVAPQDACVNCGGRFVHREDCPDRKDDLLVKPPEKPLK